MAHPNLAGVYHRSLQSLRRISRWPAVYAMHTMERRESRGGFAHDRWHRTATDIDVFELDCAVDLRPAICMGVVVW